MNNDIMVSVICLAYNHEKYIRDTLDGFIMQKTDFKYEVLVHDDASTDNTADIIREYEAKYPDIIKPVYQTENQYSKGTPIIRTYLVPQVKGKYIAFCEGDDYWTDENKLQMQVDFLESNHDFIACTHNTVMQNQKNMEERLLYSTEDKEVTFEDVIQGGGKAYHTSSLICIASYYTSNLPQWASMVKGCGDFPLSIYLTISGKVMRFGKVMSVYRYGTSGSWTCRIYQNNEKYIPRIEESIKMLEEVNKASNYRYDKEIKDRNTKFQYMIYIRKNDYSGIRKKPYCDLFKKESLKFRIKFVIRYYFPHAVNVYRVVAGRNK